MSDQRIQALLDELEELLGGADVPESGVIEAWNCAFREAVSTAERGPGWDGIVARAHRLSLTVQTRTSSLVDARESIRRELALQGQGQRALRGYLPQM